MKPPNMTPWKLPESREALDRSLQSGSTAFTGLVWRTLPCPPYPRSE